ncbi:reticulon-1 isoform X1 [Vanessa cardui]|uniref:reticulon-1 isoform X1 n=1 Tax=Vanessa cardui TaxID=171605 RepID=UPI001F135A09|nr:reticulon-1 isoform X1 [Vanessa cardui]
MDSSDKVLGGLASGDSATTDALTSEATMKRDQDSMDDFEHLDREGKRDDPEESPIHSAHGAARHVTQSFLDMERDEFVDTPRAPSVTEKAEHLADKFTDSESDADTAGESPLHRPEPPKQSAQTPEPPVPAPHDPTPTLAPTPAPAPVQPPAPTETKSEQVKEVAPTKPVEPELVEPKPQPPPQQPKPEPEPPKQDPPSPKPAPEPKPEPKQESKPEPQRKPTAHVIEAEVIFCQMGLDAWFDPQRLHPEVESLIYWRSAGRSGAALGAGLALLVALACCSVVSVLAYSSLLALSAAVAFRIYKNVLQAVQKTNEGHPFKWLLEKDISVPAERAQSLAAGATAHLNAALAELRRLFLVEDLVDSLKFGVLLWCLTYVGACFNGITLIILGWIALFTLPKAYEMNKPQVDANLELARAKINEISAKVRAAVPLGRKAESEKDK